MSYLACVNLENLIATFKNLVEDHYYNEQNYSLLHNEIVNSFAEARLDKLLDNSIEPNDKSISRFFDEFIYQLTNPKPDPDYYRIELSYFLQHILKTFDDIFYTEIAPIDIEEMIKICNNKYNLDIDIINLSRFYKTREAIILNNEVLEKYRRLFKIYLTIDDSKSLLSNLDEKKKSFIPRIMISDLNKGIDVEISMRDIILRNELDMLRKICENDIVGDRNQYGNIIEKLFVIYNITNESKFEYYLKQLHTKHDLWSLSLISLLFKKYQKMNEKKYLEKKSYNDFIKFGQIYKEYYEIVIDIMNQQITGINISMCAINDSIKDCYYDWNFMHVINWDNHWNREIISYTKSKLQKAKEFNYNQIKELIQEPNSKSYPQNVKDKRNKKQKMTQKITEEVLLYFANYCELHREDTFKEIEEKVREHFQYKFAETTLRNWLRNCCDCCNEVSGKTPMDIIKIITVDIAEKWYKDYLKAKGR